MFGVEKVSEYCACNAEAVKKSNNAGSSLAIWLKSFKRNLMARIRKSHIRPWFAPREMTAMGKRKNVSGELPDTGDFSFP